MPVYQIFLVVDYAGAPRVRCEQGARDCSLLGNSFFVVIYILVSHKELLKLHFILYSIRSFAYCNNMINREE